MFHLRQSLVFTLTAVACLLALPAGADMDLDQLWREGRFDQARAALAAFNPAAADNDELGQAARCAEELRDWPLGAGLYAQLAQRWTTAEPQAYRDAREREWFCRTQTGGTAADPAWVAAAQREIDALLAGMQGKKSAANRLGLELQYLLRFYTGGAQWEDGGTELRQRFPDSDLVLQHAKQAVDALADEPDDDARLTLCRALLKDYPNCYWRHVAWRYLLYSHWRRGDRASLKSAALAYIAEYSTAPESHGAVSRYLYDADIEAEAGLASAKRSVELYETILGCDGSAAALARLNEATADLPLQADWLLPQARRRFIDYLGSRYNLSRYLLSAGQNQQALDLCRPVVELSPFTAEEDLTCAPFQLAAGQAALGLEDYTTAYRYLLGALVSGDSTSRYSLQAESLLDDAATHLSAEQQRAARAEYLPATLGLAALPEFIDASANAGVQGLKAQFVSWGDVDGDGDPDLLLDGNRLLLNNRRGGFTAAGKAWKLDGEAAGRLFADYDNDGDLDLATCSTTRAGFQLLRNEGGKFLDFTSAVSTSFDSGYAQVAAAAWQDTDADGWLDLSLVCAQDPNYYVLRGNGTAGLVQWRQVAASSAPATSCACADVDADGDMDTLVAYSSWSPNHLWLGGEPAVEAGHLLGVAGSALPSPIGETGGHYGSSAGLTWGDIENDADLDLFCTNQLANRNRASADASQLLVCSMSAIGPRYADQRASLGVRFEEDHYCPVFADFNNDGWLDLYITANAPQHRSCLYLNDGQRFHDVTYLAGARVLNGWGCAWADFDLDGDLDLAVASPDGTRLLRNDTPPRNWLQVQLAGGMLAGAGSSGAGNTAAISAAWSNASAIGARITLVAGAGKQLREIQSGSGAGCGNELVAHFGLGDYNGRLALAVRFPSGAIVTRAILQPNQRLVIREDEAAQPTVPVPVVESEQHQPTAGGAATDAEQSSGWQRPTDTRGK
jgi:hypothetical protein